MKNIKPIIMRNLLYIFLIFFIALSCVKKDDSKNEMSNQSDNSQTEIEDDSIYVDNDSLMYYLDSTLNISVNEALPEQKFEFWRVFEDNQKDHFNQLYEIRIVDSKSGKLLQTINRKDLDALVQTDFDDYNFDGFKDMYIKDHCMILGNCFGFVYLFNKDKNAYEVSHDFDELTTVTADPKEKTIHSLNKSAAGAVFTSTVLKYIDGKLTIIETEEQDYADDSNHKYHYIHTKMDNSGKMRVIKDEVSDKPKLYGEEE